MSFNAGAAFTENARRYLNPRDLFNVMVQKFPVLNNRAKIKAGKLEAGCWIILSTNENVIGVVNPAIGKPAVELPPPGFVRWLGSCGHKIITLEITDLMSQQKNEPLWGQYFPSEMLQKYRDPGDSVHPYHAFAEKTWADVDPKLRQALLEFSVKEMIGPEAVIHDLGYAKSMTDLTGSLAKTVDGNLVLNDALHNILLATVLREEFLSY
jgi:hypothetical protein